MIEQKIVDLYSLVQNPVTYTNDAGISFEGSQKQSEFFAAWNHIIEFYKDKKISHISFLEVGAWKGLWGLAFYEFCKMKEVNGSYTTVTMIDHDPNNRPLYKTINFLKDQDFEANLVNMNTFDDRVVEELSKYGKEFNIVFIDAGHKYEEVINDIKKFSRFAKDLLIFHDIGPREVHADFGVYQAIKDSNIKLDWEVAEQLDHMGIGIHYANSNA
jgi:hypothetical protein